MNNIFRGAKTECPTGSAAKQQTKISVPLSASTRQSHRHNHWIHKRKGTLPKDSRMLRYAPVRGKRWVDLAYYFHSLNFGVLSLFC